MKQRQPPRAPERPPEQPPQEQERRPDPRERDLDPSEYGIVNPGADEEGILLDLMCGGR